jgi:hypothetical protein
MPTRTGRLGNITFKKETTYGTYIAGDMQLRAGSESIARQVGYVEDTALVSEIYTTDMIPASDGAAGALDSSFHPDVAGVLLHGVLGGEAAVADPVAAWVILSYTGTDNYQRFTKSSNTLTSETSVDGSSWSKDANFGTAGDLDISGATVDTIAELVAVVGAYTGYDAVYFGSGSVASTTIVDFTATSTRANDEILGAMLMRATVPAATLSKTHTLTPALAAAEIPSYSITVNRALGTNASVGFTGCKFSSATIAATAGELVKINLPVIAQKEETGKTDISLTLPDQRPYIASKMKIVIIDNANGTIYDMTDITDISIAINTNIDQTKVVGSEYIIEPTRQKASMDISFTALNTTTSYALRGSYTGGTSVQMFIYFLSAESIESGVPYSIMMRFPAVQLTEYNSTLSTPDRLTIAANSTVLKPKNATYPRHIYAYVVDNDLTTY